MKFSEAERIVRYFNNMYYIDWCRLRTVKPMEYSVIIPSRDSGVILEITRMSHRVFREADSFIRDEIREESKNEH